MPIILSTFLTSGGAIGAPTSGQSEQWPQVILRGDYPDPSILRDGGDYYMTHSPFLYTPGFLIWHSRDLAHWKPICRAMTKVVGSAMAPDLVKHDGVYYIYFPAAGKNWVIHAKNIRGPWSDPVPLNVNMIDPGHIVDETGKRWLFLSDGYRVRLSDDGLSVIGEKEKVYSGWDYPADWKTEGKFLESPKLIRKDGWFHMISAEGGTAGPPTSHMAISARSRSLAGPWENSPHNPLVHTFSAGERWWSKGHGTLIDDVSGRWWLVYHAYENGFYPLGRQTLIEPVDWQPDGWAKAASNAPLLPDMVQDLPLSDDFSGKELGLQWMTWRDYDRKSITLKDDGLELASMGSSPKDARLLMATATDHRYEIQVEVSPGRDSTGGLVLFYNEQAFVGISAGIKDFSLYENAKEIIRRPNTFGDRSFLKISNHGDRCDLVASGDGKTWTRLADDLDVSGMHHNHFKGFLALRPSMMAAGDGHVTFRHFQYRILP